jgi:hypothetical protein
MRRLVSTHTPVLLLLAFVSEAGAVSELRITFTESRGNLGSCCTHGISLSEVRILSAPADSGANPDYTQLPVVSITNPGGFNPVGEPPEKLIDGVTTGSKWLDYNFTVLGYSALHLLVNDTLGAPSAYELVTGNFPTRRDPVSWTVEILASRLGVSSASDSLIQTVMALQRRPISVSS